MSPQEHVGRRRKRVVHILFWMIAIVVTTLAWAGLSLKAVLAAIGL